jgi:surface carbohydrate biosynthesis protein (TIGR04326 family)
MGAVTGRMCRKIYGLLDCLAMRILFVFDEHLMIERISGSNGRANAICLFPLTTRYSIITAVENKMRSDGCHLRLLQSAKLINTSAENLRGQYIRFIAELPEKVRYRTKNLKQIFAIDRHASLWWFSLIAEKSPFKSDSFNRLAQLDAVVSVIKQEKIDKIMFGCRSEKLKNALQQYCCSHRIKFENLPARPICGLKERFRKSQKLLYLKHSMILINSIIHTVLRTAIIKKQIGSLKRAIPQNDNPLLFFAPYPNINEALAQNGVFKDKTYIYLQDALENDKRNIIWAAMYVRYNNISFKKSLEYAERFIKNGYSIFFPEEFNSLRTQIKTFFAVLKGGFKFLMLERNIHAAHTFGDYNIYPLFKDDWYSSFIGETGYRGVMYYYAFRAILEKIKPEKCLYLCEMQEWEKALICAGNALGSRTSLYGFQSGTVSRMLLNYFNYPPELSDGGSYHLPRPNKIICNGRLPYSHLQESGWPRERLWVAEALRYTHFRKYPGLQPAGEKQNIVLLALSISPEESSSVLNIVHEAFKGRKDMEIWLRPHPALQLENVFKLSGMSAKNPLFKIDNGRLADTLLKARVVVVGQSSVSIEALACGCDVVIVDVPEWINMSPLKGMHSQVIRTADSARSLQEVISGIFQEEYDSKKHAAEAGRIINDFFYLNQETDTPRNFLKLLMSTNE